MAKRKRKAFNIKTAAGRAKLAVDREPYFDRVGKGQHLGYRKNEIGGSWVAKVTQDKTRQYLALGNEAALPEYADALKAAMRWFGEATADDAPIASYTVAQAMDDYLRDLKLRKGESARKDAAGTTKKWIVPELGAIPLAKLTTKRIKAWRDGMVSQSSDPEAVRKSQDTTNRVYTVLRSALNAAFRDGAVQSDSAWRRVRPFANVGRAREVFLTSEQSKRLMNFCKPDFQPLVRSALLTGGRFGELARRTVSDLDLARGTLRIPDGKTGARNVVLSDTGIAHFKSLAKDKLPGAYLHARGGGLWSLNDQSYALRRAVAAANSSAKEPAEKLPPGTCFYSLRHSHISAALLAGVQAQVLAENCGTSVAMIEKHYGKFRNEDRRAMFNLVSVL